MTLPLDHTQPVFRALADPTRRAIIMLLADKDLRVGDIAARFEMTRPAAAKHLAVLKSADLIHVSQAGRERINHLNPAALKAATDWLAWFDRFWDDRLAALKSAVEKDT